MGLKTLLEKKLVSCRADTPLRTIAEVMKNENVGAVCVLNDGKPEGIITDRDLVLRCLAEGVEFSSEAAQAHTVMSRDVKTVRVEDGVLNACQVMGVNGVRRVVVVDEGGKAVGLLSMADVLDLIADEMHELQAATAPKKEKLESQAA